MVDYPKDWGKVKLSALVKNITTGKLDANHMVRNGKYRFYTCAKDYYYINNYAFDGEALLISGNGVYVGYVHYYKGKFNAYQRTYVLMDFSCNSIFLKYYLDYFLESQINSEMKDGNTPYIVKSTLEDFSVTIPPLPEQKAIAETLMTFDRHIENLERLIEKKKMVRDGAVEDLMTEKTRLEGFEGDWEEITIGDFLEFKNGLNKGKDFFGYGTPIINYMDVYKNHALYKENIAGKVSLSNLEIERYRVKKGDVFFTRTSETPEEVGISSVLLDDLDNCSFSGFVLRGRPKSEKILPEYCKYCFSIKKVRNSIIENCTFTTRALTNGKQLSKIALNIPSDIKEQEAIASTLTSMDEEIENLIKEKAKIEKIKAGAMDDLLTGKVRLI